MRARRVGVDLGQAVIVVAIALVASASLSACVSRFWAFDESRKAYLDCLDEHPDDPEACEDEAARASDEYDEYEREAQRIQRCVDKPDGCAPPRPGEQ